MDREDLVIIIAPVILAVVGLVLIFLPFVANYPYPWQSVSIDIGKYIIALAVIGFLVHIILTNHEARVKYLYRVAEEHRDDLIKYVVKPLKEQIYELQKKMSLFNDEKLTVSIPRGKDSAIDILWQDLNEHHVKGIKDKIAEANRKLEEFMKRRTWLHKKFRDILLENLHDLADHNNIAKFGIDYKREYLTFFRLAFYIFETDKLDPQKLIRYIVVDNKRLTDKGKVHLVSSTAFINNYRAIPLCISDSEEGAKKCGEIVARALALSWREIEHDFKDFTNFTHEIKQYLNEIIKDLDMFIYSKGIEFCPMIRR